MEVSGEFPFNEKVDEAREMAEQLRDWVLF